MLSKQGVKEALAQMGMDSSADAVEQVPHHPHAPTFS